ncbi:MAG: Tim44/TimA family putative adaptor protein [Pseudomonadota bacterium]
MPAEILLYALVAAGLVFWLRSILGTGHDDGPARPNPFTSQETQEEPDKVNSGFMPQADEMTFSLGDNQAMQDLPRNVSVDEKAQEGLSDIMRADRHFETAHFAQGSEGAFIMIVEAFAKGEREVLKDLLSPSVYKAFDSVITQRENDGETVETEIHSVRKLEILDAVMADTKAVITVQFTADETCIIRDKDGEIISGDPDRMTEMKDIWVFARDVKSKDPVWELVETRDGEPEDHKTPVPDAS